MDVGGDAYRRLKTRPTQLGLGSLSDIENSFFFECGAIAKGLVWLVGGGLIRSEWPTGIGGRLRTLERQEARPRDERN